MWSSRILHQEKEGENIMKNFTDYYSDYIDMIAKDYLSNQENGENKTLEEIMEQLYECGWCGEDWFESCVDTAKMILEENGFDTDEKFMVFINKETGSSYTKIEDVLREECLSYYRDYIEFDLDDWKVYNWNTLENELKLIALEEYRNSGWDLEDYKHYGESASWVQDFFWLSTERFFEEYATTMSEKDWNNTTKKEKKIAMFFTNYALER